MARLAGKVAWVTGAGTGIGEAAAYALAQEGAIIVLSGRREEPLRGVAARIQESGGHSHAQPGDLTHPATARRLSSFIEDTFGRLDILVNNAGVNIPDRSWTKLDPDGVDQVIHGNLSMRSTVLSPPYRSCAVRAAESLSIRRRLPAGSSAQYPEPPTPPRSTVLWQ